VPKNWTGLDLKALIKVPGDDQSNQVGETVAVIKALTLTPTFNPLEIVSDSKYVINSLMTNLT
jgi:ribonuclease HI